MRLYTLAAASAVALLLASPQVSMAKSIKELLTPQQVNEFCAANGLGERHAQLTMPDGTVVTGSIDCESENVAGAAPDDTSSASSAEDSEDDVSSSQDDSENEESGQGNDSGSSGSGGGNNGGDGGGDD